MNNKRPPMSKVTQAILSGVLPPQQTHLQLPTIQAGWSQFEVLARARGWPETVIEIARQAYFAGAQRLADIYNALPMDANVVGRVQEALGAELRQHDEDMVAMREARKAAPDTDTKTDPQ